MSSIRRLAPLFWIGWFPVVILLWAWADSRRYHSGWQYVPESRPRLVVTFGIGRAAFGYGEMESLGGDIHVLGQPPRFGVPYRYEATPARTASGAVISTGWFPAPSGVDMPGASYGSNTAIYRVWERHTPFWLILLCYLPLWLGISWWEAQRRRKKIERELAGVKDGA